MEEFYVGLVLREEVIFEELALVSKLFFEHGDFPVIYGFLNDIVFEETYFLDGFVSLDVSGH